MAQHRSALAGYSSPLAEPERAAAGQISPVRRDGLRQISPERRRNGRLEALRVRFNHASRASHLSSEVEIEHAVVQLQTARGRIEQAWLNYRISDAGERERRALSDSLGSSTKPEPPTYYGMRNRSRPASSQRLARAGCSVRGLGERPQYTRITTNFRLGKLDERTTASAAVTEGQEAKPQPRVYGALNYRRRVCWSARRVHGNTGQNGASNSGCRASRPGSPLDTHQYAGG